MKAYYDARASEYDEVWLRRGRYAARDPEIWDADVKALTHLLADLPPARTLDVGCGTGFLTRHLPGEVVGLDQSEAMLEIARRQAPRATFARGDALSLPFVGGSFDRLFASFLYCHLVEGERRRFLAEARRVARELIVVASVHCKGPLEVWEERVLNDGTRWPVYKRYFAGDALARELGGELILEGRRFLVVRA